MFRIVRRTAAGFCFLAVALLLACDGGGGPTEPAEPGAGRVLQVPFMRQQTQVWCWAATIEMVSQYYGRSIDQCQILSAYLSGNCCALPQFCLVAAPNMQTIQAGLFRLAGLRSDYVPSALPFGVIQAEIDAGRPIIVGYRGSFSGHVVVIVGYDAQGRLWIHDPINGAFSGVPYGQVFGYAGQLFWADSIIGIR